MSMNVNVNSWNPIIANQNIAKNDASRSLWNIETFYQAEGKKRCMRDDSRYE